MLKVIINYEAWESVELKEWKTTIAYLTSMSFIEGSEDLNYMDRQMERCWPWPESIGYLYDVNNNETIILRFNSVNDWEECKNTPEFKGALDFDHLEFFTYLNVDICKVVKNVTKGSPGIY